MILNSQSGSWHPDGMGKKRSTDVPGARIGVGILIFPCIKKSTSVVEESEVLVP
jgi:hypothetical protein